jgi:hypothetical protein
MCLRLYLYNCVCILEIFDVCVCVIVLTCLCVCDRADVEDFVLACVFACGDVCVCIIVCLSVRFIARVCECVCMYMCACVYVHASDRFCVLVKICMCACVGCRVLCVCDRVKMCVCVCIVKLCVCIIVCVSLCVRMRASFCLSAPLCLSAYRRVKHGLHVRLSDYARGVFSLCLYVKMWPYVCVLSDCVCACVSKCWCMYASNKKGK